MDSLTATRVHPLRPSCHLRRRRGSPLSPPTSLHLSRSPLFHSLSARSSPSHITLTVAAMSSSSQKPSTVASAQFSNTTPAKEVLEIWRGAEAVCFDVDSTVCIDEGIDELADFCGAGQAVAEWTSRAMSGSVPFEDALAARLSLFNPLLAQVEDFLAKRPPRISTGIAELINKLKANKTDVYLISGGFRQMIQVHEYKSLVMIRDGATDLEARKPGGADIFICYAGVQLGEGVAAKADWLVFGFQDLITSSP